MEGKQVVRHGRQTGGTPWKANRWYAMEGKHYMKEEGGGGVRLYEGRERGGGGGRGYDCMKEEKGGRTV